MTTSPTSRTRTTAGAAALVRRADELLLVRQERRSGVRWEVPGGGQEPGESLEETTIREVAEEAGLTIMVDRLVCTYASYRLHTSTVVVGAFYLGTSVDPEARLVPQQDDGIVEAVWRDPTTIDPDQLGPLTRRVLDRWWPVRDQPADPFHVELWRTRTGYLSR